MSNIWKLKYRAWSGRGSYDQEYLERFLAFCHQEKQEK
jgi:hypothetical protein